MERFFHCPQCRRKLRTSITACSCGWVAVNHVYHCLNCDALRAEHARKDAEIEALEAVVEAYYENINLLSLMGGRYEPIRAARDRLAEVRREK